MTQFDCNLATVIQELQDAVKAARVPKRTIVSRQANQEIPYGVTATISFDTVIDDNVSGFSVGDPTKVYIKEDGIYSLCATVRWQGATQGHCTASIRVNGTIGITGSVIPYSSNGSNVTNACSFCYPLKKDEYVELLGTQFTSTSLAATEVINLSVVKLGDLAI